MKKIFLILIILAAIPAFCLALEQFNIQLPEYLVDQQEFTVTVQSESGSAVSGATVTYAAESKETDSAGNVVFTAKKFNYVIRVSKQGFAASAITRPVKAADPGNGSNDASPPTTGKLSIEVQETVYAENEFTIVVKDEEGNVVEGASVFYAGQETQTDLRGEATLIGKSGFYLINVESGLDSATKQVLPKAKPVENSDGGNEEPPAQNPIGNALDFTLALLWIIPIVAAAIVAFLFRWQIVKAVKQLLAFIRKQFILHGKAETSMQLKEKIKAADLSYERVLYERIEGARNRALGLMIVGTAIVLIFLIFSSSFQGLDSRVPDISKQMQQFYFDSGYSVVAERAAEWYDNTITGMGLKQLWYNVLDFFYYGFDWQWVSAIREKSDDPIFKFNFAMGIAGLLAFAGPVLLLLVLVFYLNYKEEKFWYAVLKEKKEKKWKTFVYMAEPFAAMAIGYFFTVLILFVFSLMQCGLLACGNNKALYPIGSSAMQFAILVGFYFAITGTYFIKKWLKAMKMGLAEIKKKRDTLNEI